MSSYVRETIFMTKSTDTKTFILLPGYWLGAWAWDEVGQALSARGHSVFAMTLPGLEGEPGIHLIDQIDAVTREVRAMKRPVVLVAHSGSGAVASGVIDRVPEFIEHLIFVDSGPSGDGAIARPNLPEAATEIPLPPWETLAAEGSSLEDLDEGMLTRFRRQAVPHPAGPARDPLALSNPARYELPVTLICCSLSAAQIREFAAAQHPMFADVNRFSRLSYRDLPTGHWPMWSRPRELSELLVETIV